MGAKVLVIGSGGREHALAWKLSQSSLVDKIFVAPGNGGTADLAENVPIQALDFSALIKFAQEKQIDLTIVGPDDPLAAGIVDEFKNVGLKVFGPTKEAAQIEASKAFSKKLMAENLVPTAEFKSFTSRDEALNYIKNVKLPVVVKASGLALGKGVIICQTREEAQEAINKMMKDNAFGDAGSTIVIEEFLEGKEVSIHVLSDGNQAIIFPPSQDHKQLHDGDKGPNTGGMGVFAPVVWVSKEQLNEIETRVVKSILEGLASNDTPFAGCLYPGLMLNDAGPKVLEYNARFGDPETQVYMRLMDADLYKLLLSCTEGNLDPASVTWKNGFAVCVVLASGGYPGEYKKGLSISGINEAEKIDGVVVFHAGTTKGVSGIKTSGGRVLNVTATGETLDDAINKAYEAVDRVNFDGMQYRKDIGHREA